MFELCNVFEDRNHILVVWAFHKLQVYDKDTKVDDLWVNKFCVLFRTEILFYELVKLFDVELTIACNSAFKLTETAHHVQGQKGKLISNCAVKKPLLKLILV